MRHNPNGPFYGAAAAEAFARRATRDGKISTKNRIRAWLYLLAFVGPILYVLISSVAIPAFG